MTHSSVRTQTPRLPVDCKHAPEAGEFMTCASKTQASPAWAEGGHPPPLLLMPSKSISATPSRGRSFPKRAVSVPGSEERIAGAPSRQPGLDPCWPSTPLEVAFAQRRGLSRRSRVVSATLCWEREGKAGLEPVKAVGQNSSYSAVIWNCLEDVIYFVLYWFQLA